MTPVTTSGLLACDARGRFLFIKKKNIPPQKYSEGDGIFTVLNR